VFVPDQGVVPGQAAEDIVSDLLGTSKNTKIHYTTSGKGRIPDFIAKNGAFVEVKNVSSLYKTRQIADMARIAQSSGGGYPLTIVTRQSTHLSRGVKQMMRRGTLKIVACLPG